MVKGLLRTAVLFLAVIYCAPNCNAEMLLDRIVAIVNKDVITWGELYKAMEFELAKNPDYKDLSEEQRKAIYEENEASFLESMIDIKLQLQQAEKLQITTSDEEVNLTINNIMKKYSLDERAFFDAIKAEGYTFQEYGEMLREQITIGKLIDREVRSRIEITDEQIKDYLKEKNLSEGTRYRIRQILLRNPDDTTDQTIEILMEKIQSGQDFGMLAAKYSDDPAAKKTGGDLGYIEKERLAPEFAAAIEGLTPGETAQPFQTSMGVHILKLESVKDVRVVLLEMRFEKEHATWLKSLRSRSFIEIKL